MHQYAGRGYLLKIRNTHCQKRRHKEQHMVIKCIPLPYQWVYSLKRKLTNYACSLSPTAGHAASTLLQGMCMEDVVDLHPGVATLPGQRKLASVLAGIPLQITARDQFHFMTNSGPSQDYTGIFAVECFMFYCLRSACHRNQ